MPPIAFVYLAIIVLTMKLALGQVPPLKFVLLRLVEFSFRWNLRYTNDSERTEVAVDDLLPDLQSPSKYEPCAAGAKPRGEGG